MRSLSDNTPKLFDASGAGDATQASSVHGPTGPDMQPTGVQAGRLHPFAFAPQNRDENADGPDFGPSLVIDPGTSIAGLGDMESPTPVGGESTLILQADAPTGSRNATIGRNLPQGGEKVFPAQAGVLSHIVRAHEGHGCLLLHDARERSREDAARLVGGGFLLADGRSPGVRRRVRMGDALAPMRLGPPSVPPPPGREDPRRTQELSGGQRPLTQLDSAIPSAANVAAWEAEIAQINSVPEADRTPDQNGRVVELRARIAAAERQGAGTINAGVRGSRAVRGVEIVEAATPAQRAALDKRIAELEDLVQTGRATQGTARELSRLRALRDDRVTYTVGLGTGESGTIRGAQIVEEATEDQERVILQEIAELERKRREKGLTTGEQARLNELRAAARGNVTIGVGLAGAGTIGAFLSRQFGITRDSQGRETFSVFGPSRTLGAAAVSATGLTTASVNEQIAMHRENISSLQQRLDAAANGQPPPEGALPKSDGVQGGNVNGLSNRLALSNPAEPGAVESPEMLLSLIDGERAALDALQYQAALLSGNSKVAPDGRPLFIPQPDETPAEAEARRKRDALMGPSGPPLAGVRTDTLFGTWDDIGWPIAFANPWDEEAHDLVAAGDEWGVGYMKEIDGYWRPVCPSNNKLQPSKHPFLDMIDKAKEKQEGTVVREQPPPLTPPSEITELPPRQPPPPAIDDGIALSIREQPPRFPARELGVAAPAPSRVVRPIEETPPEPRVPLRAPHQGSTELQPARPQGMRVAEERLGGGPWRPDVPLVDREKGVRLVDADDFSTAMSPVAALEVVTNRLNQLISVVNEMRPFGANALDDAGIALPVQEREEPAIERARDGTVAFAVDRKDAGGNARPFVRDRGKWRRGSFDHNLTRVLGEGSGSSRDEVLIAFGEAKTARRAMAVLPRLGWSRNARELLAQGAPFHARDRLRVSESNGPKAEIDAAALTDDRALALPDYAGTVVAATSQDASGNVVLPASLTVTDVLAQGSVSLRRNGNDASDALTGTTSETTVQSYSVPLAALTAGATIRVVTGFKKTTATADSFWKVYIGASDVTPTACGDVDDNNAYTTILLTLVVLVAGASGVVATSARVWSNGALALAQDETKITTAVDLSAASTLALKAQHVSGTDSLFSTGWNVAIESPTT